MELSQKEQRKASKAADREAAKNQKATQRSLARWAKHVGAESLLPAGTHFQQIAPRESRAIGTSSTQGSPSTDVNDSGCPRDHQQVSTIDTQQSIADGICQGQRETRAAGVFDEDDRADANDAYDIPMDDDCCFTGLNQESTGTQDSVLKYRFAIAQAMCEAGSDMPPSLRISPICDIETFAYALPEMDLTKGQLNFHKFVICGIANVAKDSAESIPVAYCNCCESGMQAWRAIEMHLHESYLSNFWEELSRMSSTCLHALTVLAMAQAADGGLPAVVRSALACRPGYLFHAFSPFWSLQ